MRWRTPWVLPPGATIATTAHGMVGVAVVLLLSWKQVIGRRGLRRRSPIEPGVVLSMGLAVAATVTVVAGLLHSSGVVVDFGPLTAMQVHVGAGLVSLPLVIWHAAVRSRPVQRTDLSKRNALRLAGLAGAAAAVRVTEEALLGVAGLRGADRRLPGGPASSHRDGGDSGG